MPAYAATDSAPACPQSSVVVEQSWEAPLRYANAASSASSVSQLSFVRNAGRSDGGTEACHESPTAKRFSPTSLDRDRGEPRGSTPPTPPYVRVRIRRFE